MKLFSKSSHAPLIQVLQPLLAQTKGSWDMIGMILSVFVGVQMNEGVRAALACIVCPLLG